MPPELRNALEEGEVAEGGYLVPDTFEHTPDPGAHRERRHSRSRPCDHHVWRPAQDSVVALHGSASWIDEEGDYLESDESFGQVQLDAHKVGTVIKVSEELLQDSAFNLESYISPSSPAASAIRKRTLSERRRQCQASGILNATGGAPLRDCRHCGDHR